MYLIEAENGRLLLMNKVQVFKNLANLIMLGKLCVKFYPFSELLYLPHVVRWEFATLKSPFILFYRLYRRLYLVPQFNHDKNTCVLQLS